MLVKELCEKVVDVQRKSDTVMVIVLVFGKQVVRVITADGPQAGRPLEEKHSFYDELASKYELQKPSEMVFGLDLVKWYHQVDAAVVEGPVEKVSRKEVKEPIKKMKQGKDAGLSEVTTEIIVAGGRIAEVVMLQLCQQVLDGKGIPDEWKTSVVVPIFKGKGDVMNCGSYRGFKLLDRGMKIIERVLERRIRALVDFDEAQFGFLPGKRTTDALFLVRRLQEEHPAKYKKMYLCFVDLKKAFDRVPTSVME